MNKTFYLAWISLLFFGIGTAATGCHGDESRSSGPQSGKVVEDLAKLPASPPDPPQSKSEISKEKMEEMKQLRGKLISKRDKLKLTTEEFDKKIQTFVVEAKGELARQSLVNVTLTEAQKNRLIRNNLEAIRKAKAYQTIIATEIALTVDGEMETDRLIKHLDLDIVILGSFEDEQLDDRIKQLNLTITQIQPKAKELAINPDNTSLPSMESVWQEYFAAEETIPAVRPDKKMTTPATTAPSKSLPPPTPPAPSEWPRATPDNSASAPKLYYCPTQSDLAEFRAPCEELRLHMEAPPNKTRPFSSHSEIVEHIHKFDMACKTLIRAPLCYAQGNNREVMLEKLADGCSRLDSQRIHPSEISFTTAHFYNGCIALESSQKHRGEKQ